ncbi:hypothetical protein [Actinophytocola algeriensis]|uniref:Uncharacterized protein n=1 Tax=Actinophytocola algeriensis TaxID=1768010 RepID=A0A7W7QBK7_9PSEU|nr:hypothetical protein [Actinophytocola algeriensis]MBB4910552.1 hypothetical protein [Actinophytocola algeriensis]MBE1480459.1 hypothetical protein [Actinophytocola algeriensis]
MTSDDLRDEASPYPVFYVPWGLTPEEMARRAAAWIRQEPGTPLVFFPTKQNYDANQLLNRLTADIPRGTERNIWGSGWQRGPVLAAWPTKRMLQMLTDELATSVTALCVLEWGEPAWQCGWLTARRARSVVDGSIHGGSAMQLDPVVEVAMRDLSARVNHGNGLVGIHDKRDAVETLQVLHRAGYRFDVETLCTWALANGFSGREVERLREYAEGVQQGKRFQLRAGRVLRPDIIEIWKRDAAQGGDA